MGMLHEVVKGKVDELTNGRGNEIVESLYEGAWFSFYGEAVRLEIEFTEEQDGTLGDRGRENVAWIVLETDEEVNRLFHKEVEKYV